MNYPLFSKENNSLAKKYLTKEVFETIKDKKTSLGYGLERLIHSGLNNDDSEIGVYAGDKESYSTFSLLISPIIESYHGFTTSSLHKSNMNPEDLDTPNPDKEGMYILSTRIRVGRNLENMPLGAAISKEERNRLEAMVVDALSLLEGELAGEYYALDGMSKDVQNRLIKDHFLFKEGDRFLEYAGLNRDWPKGRGIYHNINKTFLVWVNEEDQLRIISMQEGGDIKEVFTRLVTAIKRMESRLTFSYSEKLGYITSCPTNLGTAMRASVHIALPNLSNRMDKFTAITKQYHLQIRGIDGEHTQSKGHIFDISNARRLGVTEVQAVEEMYHGVVALIAAEKALD
ncbi:MAG: Putative ATP:guanido phosphotransferase YacI (EC [uncultured Sulfurovum sp.]|uniref:ATP:guanido phosphotransferase YacI (EC) n=1 Tax=uncultured Sulfurovum sp. TaxID=269237 RepID=A0A6S6RZU3_9BACT|nr:MAG: Putative ATP:guanido phosphotransferase YacI (EC [uncultured Sulfurovum sp.]